MRINKHHVNEHHVNEHHVSEHHLSEHHVSEHHISGTQRILFARFMLLWTLLEKFVQQNISHFST